MHDYDRRKTAAAGPTEEKWRKAMTELQKAITTFDQIEFQTEGLPSNVKNEIKTHVRELEAITHKMTKTETALHVWEASK